MVATRPFAAAMFLTTLLAAENAAAQAVGGFSYLECVQSGHGEGDIYRISSSNIEMWNIDRLSWRTVCRDPDYFIDCSVDDRYVSYEARSRSNGRFIYNMRIQRSTGRSIFSTDGGSRIPGICRSVRNPEPRS